MHQNKNVRVQLNAPLALIRSLLSKRGQGCGEKAHVFCVCVFVCVFVCVSVCDKVKISIEENA